MGCRLGNGVILKGTVVYQENWYFWTGFLRFSGQNTCNSQLYLSYFANFSDFIFLIFYWNMRIFELWKNLLFLIFLLEVGFIWYVSFSRWNCFDSSKKLTLCEGVLGLRFPLFADSHVLKYLWTTTSIAVVYVVTRFHYDRWAIKFTVINPVTCLPTLTHYHNHPF